MISENWQRTLCLALLGGALALLVSGQTALAQGGLPDDDLSLAQMYAPVLWFHPKEVFRPQPVEVLVNSARLCRTHRFWFSDIHVLPDVSIAELLGYREDSYALDAWYGDEGSSDYMNYTAHRSYYQAELSPEAAGLPIVTYAHVVRDEEAGHVTIQYWLFYYYNDWFNKHEGDWEMVQVMLDAAGEPRWVVLSQHHGGTRRSWQRAPLRGETHPLVYVALGSHANYFWGAEAYPNGTSIGSARIEIMDRTGSSDQAMPEVILIPGREQAEADPGQWPGLEWLSYRGRWGEIGIQSDFGGPYGPADKGEQWERPHAWGMDQPLDVEAWYANRLRVEVIGQAAEGARVTLRDAKGAALPPAELLGSLALLHADPAPGQTLVAEVEVPPAQPYALLVAWPDRESSQVTRYVFEDVPSSAALTLRSDAPPVLVVQGRAGELSPKTIEVEAATWDVPDLVWLAGRMPASDVVRGFGISLLAGLAPTALYVGLLYWADRYEKEPKAMLAAAFLWGALPALLVAVAARLFFQVPVQLVGPQAIEAVRAGLVAPLIGEALKGAVVVWIALRYPLEFDNVLDGIIYGAMVGFGFAMTGNTLSYLGSFLLRGFDGLSSTIFIEGVLYGLNHALYTALFGAGLGYARLARQRWQRWAVPLVAFGMAVTGHASHNLALSRAIGLNLWTAAVTWAGVVLIVVVMVWSLQQQRRWLVAELAGEVPEEVYRAMTARRGRARASWQALRQRGFGGWRQARRVHQQCAELSAKKAQRRRRPDEPGLAQEIERLRSEIADLLS